MAGASADGEVNHWPAFVDVLTTVIMVVTFLLVIMSAAVMQLSQRVIQQFKQQLVAQQEARERPAERTAAAAAKGGAQGLSTNPIRSPRDAETGSSIAELGSILKSDTTINGSDRLTIRTRETKDTLAIQVKALEQPDTTKGVEVKTADTLLKVSFAAGALNYDSDNANKVVGFLRDKGAPGVRYEIWSLAPQTGAISDAQRIAYFRAAMTRNLLVRAGIRPADIFTQVRVTDPKAPDGHMVRVVVKP